MIPYNMSKMLVTPDKRLNYVIVPLPLENEDDLADGVRLCPNEHMISIDKYDMYVPLKDCDKAKHKTPLPLSFLQIQEGDVESGVIWYKQHYPKIPDELIHIMARYNFGDLKYATRKSIRNNAKKHKKKHGKPPPLGLEIKKEGPYFVDFG